MQNLYKENYLSTIEIMEKLKVSKDWIYKQIRPHMPSVKLEEANETTSAVKAYNTVYYRKEDFYRFLLSNIHVYTRNYWDYNERQRGPEYEVPIPDNIRQQILNGEFPFYNIKDIMAISMKTSEAAAARWIFNKRLYTIKLFGKTYYESP